MSLRPLLQTKDWRMFLTCVVNTISINGYVAIRHDRTSGAGGGVIAFVLDNINFQRRTDLENQSIEAVWLELFFKNSLIIHEENTKKNHKRVVSLYVDKDFPSFT